MSNDTWTGFVDAVGEPAPAPVAGRRVVHDVDLPDAAGADAPVRVVLTGGAGQLAGPVALAARLGVVLGAVETAVRDLADPAGSVRRVVTAATDLPDGVALHVGVRGPLDPGWLRALDDLAAVEDAVVVLDPAQPDLEAWVDACLDRELGTGLVDGTADAVLAALRTTARLWGDPEDLLAARRWCRSWRVDDGAAAARALAEARARAAG